MHRPTVFLSNFHPYVTKNTLNSGVLNALSKKAKVVILVIKEKEAYFRELYARGDIIVEGIDLGPDIRSLRNKSFIRLSELLLDTSVMKFHQMESLERTGGRIKYIISRAFTKVCARSSLLKACIRWLDYIVNNSESFQRLLNTYRPDTVFATDAFGDHDGLLLKNAKAAGVRTVAMVRSWDNTTSRGYLRFIPDRLIVHNEVMKKEMSKYHDIKPSVIYLCGVPQFEKYRDMKPSPREEFYGEIGANPLKRLVLFAPAGGFYIDSDWHTCQMLKELYHENRIPQDVQFLVRLHPFLPVDLSRFESDENFIIDAPGPAKPSQMGKGKKEGELDMAFFQHIYDSIYYSSLAINTISSIIIDTAIFDKPLITINFDGWLKNPPVLRSLVKRWRLEENQINWMAIGSTRLAANKEELAVWINTYLEHPELDRERRKNFVQRYCWKYDGKSAERIASIVLSDTLQSHANA